MKNLIVALLLFYPAFAFSQGKVSMNMELYKKLQDKGKENSEIDLLVKGNIADITEFTKKSNGKIILTAGDIASVRLRLKAVAELVLKPYVKRIGFDRYHYTTLNDTMRMRAFVDQVHAGQSPLTQSYKGKNVIMGIIDSGIDTDHPDFQDSTGNTRVKWLWDMTKPVAGNTPQPYGYGQEWSAADINSGLSSSHTGEDQFGHGTYTAGIAAGNGSAVGRFQGVAPESDLIVVGFDFNAIDNVPRVAHGIDYIFTKAQQLGKPCVINVSLGDYYGSHDGLDMQSQLVNNLLNSQSGRVVVQACGDIGVNYPFHVECNSVNGDTVFSWIKGNALNYAYLQIYADTADFNNIHYSIGADKVNPYYEFRGQIPFTTIAGCMNQLVSQDLMVGGNRIGNIQTFGSESDGVYLLEAYITLDSTDYFWRFITTGNGKYDSWNFDFNISPIPAPGVFPDIAKYIAPDTTQSIVGGINCLNNVISVANYTNTDRHYDVDTILRITTADSAQYIAVNSGRGPTRKGLVKPDLAGPGNHIISSGVLTLIPGLLSSQRYKVAEGAQHITGGGTSASAPVVAGIAALYLEQNPSAGWFEVKNALTTCAFTDSFMWGPYPNNAWGYGKVSGFEALTTCSLSTSAEQLLVDWNTVLLYPNPAQDELRIDAGFINRGNCEITDINGRSIFVSEFQDKIFTLKTSNLPEGVYLLKLISEKYYPVVKSFIISR